MLDPQGLFCSLRTRFLKHARSREKDCGNKENRLDRMYTHTSTRRNECVPNSFIPRRWHTGLSSLADIFLTFAVDDNKTPIIIHLLDPSASQRSQVLMRLTTRASRASRKGSIPTTVDALEPLHCAWKNDQEVKLRVWGRNKANRSP